MSVGCHEHDNGVVAGYLAELLERTAEHELLESRHSSDLAEDRLYAAGLLVANVLRREIAVRRPWRLDHNRRRGCSNRAQKRLQLDRQVLGNVLQLWAALAERLRPYGTMSVIEQLDRLGKAPCQERRYTRIRSDAVQSLQD
jgi:hypothetical protein